MAQPNSERIRLSPQFAELVAKRSRFAWTLTACMLIIYFGFILLVAFKKDFLASRLGEGVMTMGMPIGLGVIVFTIIITWIYVRRANSEFDALTESVTRSVLK